MSTIRNTPQKLPGCFEDLVAMMPPQALMDEVHHEDTRAPKLMRFAMATNAKNARLNVRLSKQQKKLIELAAGFLGQTVSAFTVATLVRQAEEVVERSGTLRLSDRDRDAFLTALDNPPELGTKLRRAAECYAANVAR